MNVQAKVSAPYAMLIDGQSVTSPETLEVVNPATEEVIATIPDCSREQLDQAVAAARRAFPDWRARPIAERRDILNRAAAVLAENAEELKHILTAEQGKPLDAALFELQAAAWWIGEAAKNDLPVQTVDDMPGQRSIVRRVPLGVVGAIVPWNFPVLLAVWKLVPALLAGNTLVLKPSPFTPLTTLRLAEKLAMLIPAGVLNIITGGDRLGPWMTAHPGIDKITFTGSSATGRKVMETASASLKRVTLELGGNDAAIVLPDAKPAEIAEKLFWAAMTNSGQVCVAAKRIYVHDSIYDALAAALKNVAERVTMGDGTAEGVALGPVQNAQQFARVQALIADSRAQGHRFLTGGHEPKGKGYFVPVTIIDNPPETARVVQEEAFGPVVPLLRYSDLDEVVARANATDMGLAGSIWTSDIAAGAALAERLETGTVWINSAQNLTPYAAFGGHKQSGIGTEGGLDGLLEFTVPQTIHTPC